MTNANITRTETRAATARARWERLNEAAGCLGVPRLLDSALIAAAEAATDAGFTTGTDDWRDMALELLPETATYRTFACLRAFIARIEDGE